MTRRHSMITRRVMAAAVALVCAASTTACGGDSPAVSVDIATVLPFPYTTVWSADPGIDLIGRGAELIRVAEESIEYTFAAGPETTYPGYFDAVRDSNSWITPGNPGFRTEGGTNYGRVHTWFRHVVDYSVNSNSVSATVCSYRLFQKPTERPGEAVLSDSVRITLVNSAELPGKPGIVDTDVDGHDPRAQRPPVWNVFGNWKIAEYTSIRSDAIPQQCIDWWKLEFPMFTTSFSGSRALRSPPGYVMPTMPMAVQYPEWIGPTDVS